VSGGPSTHPGSRISIHRCYKLSQTGAPRPVTLSVMGVARGCPPAITLRSEEGDLRPFLNGPDSSLNATCALASRTA
jgi:hypothetical protein